jgi:hypothetical protein
MAIADEMQGIMSLPEETAAPTPEQTAAVDQMRSQLSPSEINTEMLGAAEEADPATVAEFKAELQGLQLPPDVLDMLNTMVEEILDAPQDYEAIRAKYMAQGLEDLLPPEFDPAFFGALNMAIDQIRGGASPMAQAPMPSGVNTVEDIFTYNPAAAPASMPPEGFAQGGIASLGRNGDTMLAHITPDEAAMLRRRGGSGSINPATGLPEFFSLKGVFKKLGSAVKKFASSTVGKIVIGAALFYFSAGTATGLLGGFGSAAVAAGQGFIAGAGTNLLAGGNLKDSLKAGAKGALTAGALNGITQGASAFKAIPKAVPAEVRDVVAGVKPGETAAFPVEAPTKLPSTPLASQVSTGVQTPVAAPPSTFTSPYKTLSSPGGISLTGPNFGVATAPSAVTTAGAAGSSTPPTGFFGNVKAAINPNDDVGIMKGLNRAFNPNEIKAAGITRAEKAYIDTLRTKGSEVLAQKAYDAAMPGMIQQYAPLVAGGLGIMGLAGGFEEEKVTPPEGFEDFMSGSAGQRLLDKDPSYRINYGGVNTTSTTPQYAPYGYIPPRAAAKGGSMNKDFPRKNGPINGPGTGTSDDVPAMLSDGEFVFTAKAVRAMGNGSRRAGAKRMYAMMKNLEGRSNA